MPVPNEPNVVFAHGALGKKPAKRKPGKAGIGRDCVLLDFASD